MYAQQLKKINLTFSHFITRIQITKKNYKFPTNPFHNTIIETFQCGVPFLQNNFALFFHNRTIDVSFTFTL